MTYPFRATSARWRKSSFSGSTACVEVGEIAEGGIAIRDSKAPDGGVLLLSRLAFGEFLHQAKRGDFDDLC